MIQRGSKAHDAISLDRMLQEATGHEWCVVIDGISLATFPPLSHLVFGFDDFLFDVTFDLPVHLRMYHAFMDHFSYDPSRKGAFLHFARAAAAGYGSVPYGSVRVRIRVLVYGSGYGTVRLIKPGVHWRAPTPSRNLTTKQAALPARPRPASKRMCQGPGNGALQLPFKPDCN